MLECLILGDDIALGIAQFRTECRVIAEQSVNSRDFTHNFSRSVQTDIVIISLGNYDSNIVNTRDNLNRLRSRITASCVYWVLPRTLESKRSIVESVARQRGDRVIDAMRVQGDRDQVVPARSGLQRLAEQTRGR